MGIINLDTMVLKSGLQLKDCYLSFTSGPHSMPVPINFSWSTDENGLKQYFAYASLYVFASPEKKYAGHEPIESSTVSIPVDGNAVFSVLFASLKNQYPNFENIPGDEADTSSPSGGQNTAASGSEPTSDQ